MAKSTSSADVAALQADLDRASKRQRATADVLRAISSSPAELQPVLDAIVITVLELCDAYDVAIVIREGDFLVPLAHRGPIPITFARWPITRGWVTGRAFVDGTPVHVVDLLAEADEFPEGHAMAMQQGHRTILATPLKKREEAVGAIILRRLEVRPFNDTEIELVTSFADQAMIAIDNARRSKDLTDALEFQTATSEVLNVISRSPSQVQPVLDTIVETATRLCGADFGYVFRLEQDGRFHLAASDDRQPRYTEFLARHPIAPGDGSLTGRVAIERRTIHVPNAPADPSYRWPEWLELTGFHTFLS